MSRSIAVLVTEGFEDSEYLSPVDALRAAGYAIFNIDVEPGRIVKSRAEQLPLRIDLGIDQARAADYAGLLIPGGRRPAVAGQRRRGARPRHDRRGADCG